MLKLFIGKVIFTVLVPKFELRRFGFTQGFLEGIEFLEIVYKRGTLIIVTFVNRAIFTMFPKVERRVAMRAPEFCFVSQAAMKVKETIADFAFDLRTFSTVVEVEIF